MLSPRRCVLAAALASLACRPTPASSGPISPTVVPAPSGARVPDGAPTIGAVAGVGGHCDASHGAALRVFPSEATVLAGADVASIVQAPAFAPFLGLDGPSEMKPVLAAATACGLGRDTWRSITLGGSFAGSSSAVAFRAQGAGSIDKLECIRAKLEVDSGKSPFSLSTTTGSIELSFPSGSHGWVIDPCTVVVAEKDWIAPVRERIEGRGTGAIGGQVAGAVARADSRKHAWLGMTSEPTGVGGFMPGVQDLAIAVQVTSRVSVSASFSFADPSVAAKQSADLEKQLSSMKSMLVSVGVPQTVVDRIKIGPAGQFVMLTADADEQELAKIAGLISGAQGR